MRHKYFIYFFLLLLVIWYVFQVYIGDRQSILDVNEYSENRTSCPLISVKSQVLEVYVYNLFKKLVTLV
jgi:hypothetical protein